MHRRGAVLPIILAAGALGLGACGSDGDDAASTTAGPAGGGTPASGAAPSGTQVPVGAKKKSPDSDAPQAAPAHWLPPEAWVYNHWLPYDEAELYKALKVTRSELWQQLRDDRRTLAQLAAERGYPDPATLAKDLVDTRDGPLTAARRAQLERRAVQSITQGHLSQHLFFHSLHQFAIPSAAPDIFGVSDVQFRRLRREELSPLAIGRLNGRSPGAVQGTAIAVLRERVQAGVRGDAMSKEQGALLLRRQLTQLPRWLDQARYNGPPLTFRGNLETKPQDYASNPTIAAGGRHVVYEGYRQKLPLAVQLGEIAVLRADLRTGRTVLVSGLAADGKTEPDPVSAYNPAISADGRLVTYESSPGNQNFAKRYGRIGTVLGDVSRKTSERVGTPIKDVPDSQSSYNPDIAGAGRRVIFQAVRDGRTAILAADVKRPGRETTVFAGTRAGGLTYADPYEASVSRDGRRVVFTLASGTVGDAASARSSVRVRDLRTGTTRTVSRANGRGAAVAAAFSADPAISPDGGFVAFTSTDAALPRGAAPVGLFLRDLRRGRTTRIPVPAGARPLDPAVSTDGRVVAFTAVRGEASRVLTWRRGAGTAAVASRATGPAGVASDRRSGDPSVSADGRRVAFSSTATNLAKGADGARAIYVRDLRTRRTRLVSEIAKAYAGRTVPLPATPPAPPVPGPVPSVSAAAGDPSPGDAARTVFVTDNAFFDGGDRPVVRVQQGESVRFLWRSRQSHSVFVRSGPTRFASKVRNKGSFEYTFQEAGTYEVVCTLHAPGMKATVVVEPG